jgi:hypothetical protein
MKVSLSFLAIGFSFVLFLATQVVSQEVDCAPYHYGSATLRKEYTLVKKPLQYETGFHWIEPVNGAKSGFVPEAIFKVENTTGGVIKIMVLTNNSLRPGEKHQLVFHLTIGLQVKPFWRDFPGTCHLKTKVIQPSTPFYDDAAAIVMTPVVPAH